MDGKRKPFAQLDFGAPREAVRLSFVRFQIKDLLDRIVVVLETFTQVGLPKVRRLQVVLTKILALFQQSRRRRSALTAKGSLLESPQEVLNIKFQRFIQIALKIWN